MPSEGSSKGSKKASIQMYRGSKKKQIKRHHTTVKHTQAFKATHQNPQNPRFIIGQRSILSNEHTVEEKKKEVKFTKRLSSSSSPNKRATKRETKSTRVTKRQS